jgi:aminomethyltransferase
MPLRESPLAALHEAAEAKMVEFAGWRLPLQFTSIAEEATTCRRAAALFDISHMGVIHLVGSRAREAASRLLTRAVRAIPPGCSGYAFMCNESGGVLDDLIVTVISDTALALVVNAVNHDKDLAWVRAHLTGEPGVEVDDLRGRSFALALQGPKAEQMLTATNVQGRLPDQFGAFSQMRLSLADVLVSRTGYTGEDGFEIFGAAGDGQAVWKTVMDFGREHGLVAAGLGARDVLRQEMGYPLWGQDLDEQTTPLEAGYRWAVNRTADFIGRAALESSSPARRRIGFVMEDQGVARTGCAIYAESEEVGRVTSGTYSHNLGLAIGQGYVSAARPPAALAVGARVEIEVRGRRLAARVARLPFLPAKTRPSCARPREKS